LPIGRAVTGPLRTQRILRELITPATQEVTLPNGLCALCAHALPVSGAALALRGSVHFGLSHLIGVTPGLAAVMEDLQFELGEGPSSTALQHERPVECPDLTAWPSTWPMFVPAATAGGAASIFAFPVTIAGDAVGVLTLYRESPGPLTAEVRIEAHAYAEAAAAMVLHLLALSPADDEELHPQLTGLSSRADLHIAVGMVSVQANVHVEDALLLLRARAFTLNTPLLHLAADVVTGKAAFTG
jgi:hypothetical protein